MPDLELRERIYDVCFEGYDGTLANGEYANNKFDLEKIAGVPDLRTDVVWAMASLVMSGLKREPDLVVAVPNGANWLGLDIADVLGAKFLRLEKNPATKEFSYMPGGLEEVRAARQIVVVDDVFNKFTNTKKALALEGMLKRTGTSAVAIIDRNPNRTVKLSVPHRALITEDVPAVLSLTSPLWRFVTQRSATG